jgi:predicted helicase
VNAFVNDYVSELNKKFQTRDAREHAYRPALQRLFEQLEPNINAINEPKHIKDVGAPDFVIKRKEIPLGYAEAKDITENIDDPKHKEQFDRYLVGLENLIITNYLRFQFWRSGEKIADIEIARIEGGGMFGPQKIVPISENDLELENLLRQFIGYNGKTIKSATELSKIMALKARAMANVIVRALKSDNDEKYENRSLYQQLDAFRSVLLPEITIDEFADVYSQTIAYGMFVARLQDKTPDDFSRQEAVNLIPRSNPFLKKLFGYIAGPEFDERIEWVVDDLARLFRAAALDRIMVGFGAAKKTTDPVVHFYEDFLADYNPKLRKARGVWYTPEPVVNYIVRAVDSILKTDFNLPNGLADNSTILYKTKTDPKLPAREIHKVQILDPATGTGTFLASVIRRIYENQTANGLSGVWNDYVGKDLLPRIHGFEILMASYAMAHLKLDMILAETGYRFDSAHRLGVYLTNSLEEGDREYNRLPFDMWLAEEARAASVVKTDIPVMVVLGNPPYSVSSSNKGKWITELMDKYKENLNERNIQPLSDDYIKFIRLAQNYIDKNGSGVFSYISNNSYLDGLIHRQMRKSLLDSFDTIYIINLHGNSNIHEIAPDNQKDENVFDIQQGVSISIFVKSKNASRRGFFYTDVWGKRKDKNEWLDMHELESDQWQKLEPTAPSYFFAPKDFSGQTEYERGFKIDELCATNTSGIKTHNDAELISFDRFTTDFNNPILYRPFDTRWINYDLSKVVRHRYGIMKQMLKDNVAIIATRQFSGGKHFTAYITNTLTEISSQPYAGWVIFPLWIYDENSNDRRANLNPKIVREIESKIRVVSPQDLFDYIYAVLHSSKYRQKYREFLKIDFPRIPYPATRANFDRLVKLGAELRNLHLMKTNPSHPIVKYEVSGTNKIDFVKYFPAVGNTPAFVQINDSGQWFDNVSETAWNFYIGGYQPAQKWLKDRKGRTLSTNDIIHYQKIIWILTETDRIMKEIDNE